MTYNEESYLLDTISGMASEMHENNLMLQGICKVVNTYLANHNKENEEDFGRNVLANLLSSMVDIKSIGRRKR
jgi:hypothetical protein